jgi:hypothetical protein
MATDYKQLLNPLGGGDPLKGTPFSSWNYDPTQDNESAMAGINQIRDAYGNLKVPEYTPVDYQGPQEAADIRVDPAALERVGPSAYDQISSDPQYKAAQIAQLSALSELRDKGGMNLTDKANLLQLQQEAANNSRSQRAAVMQNAQMRGMGGSNQTLMNQLNANQQAQTIGSNEAMRTAGMAQDRALQAGNSAAGLAGQMGTTDFNQQAQVAAARDNAAKFNAQMSNANSQFNAGQQFNQQAANQRKSQGVNDATAMAGNNSQTMNRYTMPNAQFGNAATKAGGLANAGKAQSDYYGNQAAAGQRAQGGLLGGVMQLGGSAMSAFGGGSGGAAAAGGQGATAGGAASGGASQPAWGASNGSNYNLGLGQGAAGSSYTPTGADYGMGSMAWKYGTETPTLAGFSDGGMVPGRAPIPGDSAQNDTVPAALSPGEIVMPRSVTQDPNKQAQLNALMGIRNRGV